MSASGEAPRNDQPIGDQSGGDQPGGERSGSERSGGHQLGGGQLGGGQLGGGQPGGDKSGDGKPGDGESGGEELGGPELGDQEQRVEPGEGESTGPRLLSLREQAQVLAAQRAQRARLQAGAGALAAVVVVALAVAAMLYFTGDDDASTTPANATATADTAASAPPTAASGTDAPSAVAPNAADTAAVVRAATTVPAAVLDKVGRGQISGQPQQVSGQPALTEGGKPLVLYVGAEYCPFCASQRWAMVVALSRFGTFENLKISHSASDDVYPDTQTLSFHGATYTSRYLTFQGVEVSSNVREGNGYAPLGTLTPKQQQVFQTLNAPPYVSADSAGAIPFLDLGNKYVMVGGSYQVELLQGKSAQEIAAALSDPQNPIARGVHGSANLLTGLICQLTKGQPGQVCDSKAAKSFRP